MDSKKVCCCLTLRKVILFFGVFSLIFYGSVIAGSAFQITLSIDDQNAFYVATSYLLMIFGSLCFVSSIVLILGICVESKVLMLPWVAVVTFTNVFSIIFTLSTKGLNEEVTGDLTFDISMFCVFMFGNYVVHLEYRRQDVPAVNVPSTETDARNNT